MKRIILSLISLLVIGASAFSLAEMAELDETQLSDVTAREGLRIQWEGLRFIPKGLHPIPDPDNPPFFKFVYTANKFAFYGDSTADGEQLLDFWVYINRITTNPETAYLNNGVGGMALTFDLDAASRQSERLIQENGGVATGSTKMSYMVMSINDNLDLGSGDINAGSYSESTRYVNLSGDLGAGSGCEGVKVGNADCQYRGFSLHDLDSDSLSACAAGPGACDAVFMKEFNFFGNPTISGQILVYGRDGSL